MPHAHCYLFGLGTAEAMALTTADRYFVCMPLFHANALLMQFIGSLIAGPGGGGRAVPGHDVAGEVRAAEATITNGLGVIPEFIFRQPATARDRDHRLRADDGGADRAGVGRGLRGALRRAVPAGLRHDRVQHRRLHAARRCRSRRAARASRCATGSRSRIVDPATDAPVPPGQAGEIVVRPKVPGGFMAGYFRMPEKTVEAWRNLWFHTGDAGRIDERGPPALRRPHQGLHPPAGREHLELRDRAGAERAPVGGRVGGGRRQGGRRRRGGRGQGLRRARRRAGRGPGGAARLVHAPHAATSRCRASWRS